MAWFRQGSQSWQAGGVDPSMTGDQRASLRVHDHGGRTEQQLPSKIHSGLDRNRSWRSKRVARPVSRIRRFSVGIFIFVLLVVMVCTFFGADYVFAGFKIFQGEDKFLRLPGSGQEKWFYGFGGRSNVGDIPPEKEDSEGQELKSGRRRKHSVTCEIAFRNTTDGLEQPTDMSIYERFPLNYIQNEQKPEGASDWRPKFAGHQSLMQREESFLARNQSLHCGFVEGPEGYAGTGFELSEDDKDYLQSCHIAVSSCIFGNYDRLHNPVSKKVSGSSREKVCFAMFVDQQTLDGMIEEGEVPDGKMTYGLWRIVLVQNLPYSDNRRTGKVPKLLTHRLFPNARYSLWLDSKLRLQSDPLLILEHFLWRGNNEYAISNHYDRHCVWEEVAQNKKLNKFDHGVIDEQFEFYQKDGLTRFNASDPYKVLPSHVPEGSFIVRAHTPMSNLFSCLWFNEVERFTSRDQLSFAYTYLKFVRMNPFRHFRFHMFKDCERREMTKLYHHKPEENVKR
ncbi:unnamed protein product [Calypogeia fissa]